MKLMNRLKYQLHTLRWIVGKVLSATIFVLLLAEP